MKASCLCGAVEVTAPDHNEVSVCHCSLCRRWGGGPMFAVHCGHGVSFAGSAKPRTFRSSEWAERGFCPNCGTHLFYHLLPSDEYILSAGLFQDQTGFRFASQIFIDEKPAYYDFANPTPTLTGKQVFEQFSGGGG